MSNVPLKYQPATLPASKDEAIAMAEEREMWAANARKGDQYGSAREFELMAQLLRFYATTATWHYGDE